MFTNSIGVLCFPWGLRGQSKQSIHLGDDAVQVAGRSYHGAMPVKGLGRVRIYGHLHTRHRCLMLDAGSWSGKSAHSMGEKQNKKAPAETFGKMWKKRAEFDLA